MSRVPKLVTLAIVTAIAAGMGFRARDLTTAASGTHATPSSATSSGSRLAVSSGTDVRAACVDATTSSDPEFASGVMMAIARDVAEWDPPLPSGVPSSAQPSVPALELVLRQVETRSFSTQVPSLDLQIPAVPALNAPPALSDPNLGTDELAWASREHAWLAALKRADAAEASAVAALNSYKLDDRPGNWSAISGCTAALAAQAPLSPSGRILLASDLRENQPPVAVRSYQGTPILIDQNCTLSAELCRTLAASWIARFQSQGAGPVTVVRADAASQAIQNWLGGRS